MCRERERASIYHGNASSEPDQNQADAQLTLIRKECPCEAELGKTMRVSG